MRVTLAISETSLHVQAPSGPTRSALACHPEVHAPVISCLRCVHASARHCARVRTASCLPPPLCRPVDLTLKPHFFMSRSRDKLRQIKRQPFGYQLVPFNFLFSLLVPARLLLTLS